MGKNIGGARFNAGSQARRYSVNPPNCRSLYSTGVSLVRVGRRVSLGICGADFDSGLLANNTQPVENQPICT